MQQFCVSLICYGTSCILDHWRFLAWLVLPYTQYIELSNLMWYTDVFLQTVSPQLTQTQDPLRGYATAYGGIFEHSFFKRTWHFWHILSGSFSHLNCVSSDNAHLHNTVCNIIILFMKVNTVSQEMATTCIWPPLGLLGKGVNIICQW